MIITEERRQQLIAFNRAIIAQHEAFSVPENCWPADVRCLVDSARVALAALEAKPLCWTDESELRSVETHQHGYIFNANPVSDFADSRRVIRLYRALPVPVMKPIELPSLLQPAADGYDDWYMNSSEDGEYMKAEDVIKAIRAAGYEVKE